MANRDFKIELDNVEMINGSDDLLKDTKVTKVTLTGENKLNSLNSTFENCTELTAIEGDINLDGVSDMTEMTLNTPLDEVKVTNPTEETIQATNSLNQATNVKIGGTKYSKGGIQDVVGSLDWDAENFTYEDTILENVYTNSSNIIDNKNLTIQDTLEQKATSFEVTGQTYMNLVDGKNNQTLLDEMSMQQVEGSPTNFTPHIEQPICVESIEGQTYQNLVDGKGERVLIDEYKTTINDFIPNTFEPPQNQPICIESMEGETYQNLIKGKGEYKLTDAYSHTWTEENNKLENMPNAVEIPEIWGNTVQDESDLNIIQSVGDLYVNGRGEPILDEEGNEQYKLEIESSNNINLIDPNGWIPSDVDHIQIVKLEPNTKYIYYGNQSSNDGVWHSLIFCDIDGNESEVLFSAHCPIRNVYKFTTGDYQYVKVGWGTNNPDNINSIYLPMLVKGSTVLPYIEGTGNNQSNKTTILMPQPLRKIKYTTKNVIYYLEDKLRYENGKYVLDRASEIHYLKPYLNNLSNGIDVGNVGFKRYSLNVVFEGHSVEDIDTLISLQNSTNYRGITLLKGWGESTANVYWETKRCYSFVCASNNGSLVYRFEFLLEDSLTREDLLAMLDDSYVIIGNYKDAFRNGENRVEVPYFETVETKILEKPSLDAYSPKTYITTSTEVQPSQMSITNKEVKFIPLSLQPSKSYTIQLDSVGKDNKPITVNLGGATTTIQPTNDTSKHHRVSITTPSSLTTDNLDLSGEGVVVNNVMLFEGNTSVIKQDVDYMDGIQSIGEPFESRNLFDYTQSEVGLLDHTNGNISEDNSWKYTTDFIPVKPNTTYCISQTSGSVFNYKIVEYNTSKGYLKGTNWTSSKGTDINRAYNTFTTSANTYYLRLGWQSSIFEIQLEEDTFPTEFMAFDTVRYKLEIQTYDSTWDKL